MHPVLFNIFGLTVYTYGFFLSLAFLVGFISSTLEAKRRDLSVETAIDLTFWILLSAVIMSRLIYVLVNVGEYIHNPIRILMFWEGGLIWYGAFLGAISAAGIYSRVKGLDGWVWADVAIPFVALGQAIGRIGCLMAGCCYGKPTDLPWAIVFTESHIAPGGIPIHPTQLYHSISNLMIFAFLFYRRKRATFRGELILSYVFLYSATRSILEVVRGDPRGYWFGDTVSTSQLISLIAVVVGAILYYRIRDKNRIRKTGKVKGGKGAKRAKKGKR